MKRTLAAATLSALLTLSPVEVGAQEFETTEIVEGVYQFRFETHNTFFVVTPEGTIAFDPISAEAAERYAEAIRRHSEGGRLHGLVYSHNHADHVTGAPTLFEELGEVPIIGHEKTYEKLAERDDPRIPPPDITFREAATLRLGGREIELHHLGPNHGEDLIVAYLPKEKVVFAVDFVSNDRVGYRDLPGSHYPGLIESMKRLQELDYQRIVFGHGPPGDRGAVERQIRYYRDLRRAVAEAMEDGASVREVVDRVELPEYGDWGGYDAWFEMNVRKMHEWLREEGSEGET